jgi:hypothetical protein
VTYPGFLIRNQQVVGSNPTGGSKNMHFWRCKVEIARTLGHGRSLESATISKSHAADLIRMLLQLIAKPLDILVEGHRPACLRYTWPLARLVRPPFPNFAEPGQKLRRVRSTPGRCDRWTDWSLFRPGMQRPAGGALLHYRHPPMGSWRWTIPTPSIGTRSSPVKCVVIQRR